MPAAHLFVVSIPFGQAQKKPDLGHGFYQQRIVDGPHFSKFAAYQSAKVLRNRLNLESSVETVKPQYGEDDNGKKFVIYPQRPDEWIMVAPPTVK